MTSPTPTASPAEQDAQRAPASLRARAVDGRLCLRTLGGSMFPFIPSGSWLLVSPAASRALRVGDVVVFPGPEGLVTHRIIAIDGESPPQLTVRGDAQTQAERLSADAVAYVVEAVHRHGITYRTDSLLGRLGRTLAVRAPGALLVLGSTARTLLSVRR